MTPSWADHAGHIGKLMKAALTAADPARALREHLSLSGNRLQVGETQVNLQSGSRIYVVGSGKAGVAMGRAAAEILGGRLTAGVMAVPQVPEADGGSIEWIGAGHPLPDEGSLQAGRRIEALLADSRPHDAVLALISGGGSALLELPVPGVSLDDLKDTTDKLLLAGASIRELNAVRHQLSRIKGGGLARMAQPAVILSLILSDVVGDRLDIIASGPTVRPATTRRQARAIVERYRLTNALPDPVVDRLRNDEGEATESGTALENVIIAGNHTACAAARQKARDLGFSALIVTTWLEGEASQAGAFAAGMAKTLLQHGQPIPLPACLVMGGETIVHVKGDGSGGRNQELALAAAIELDGWQGCALASFGTDGIDGPTPSAGALVTGETAGLARSNGMSPEEHLARNDSHALLAAIDADLRIGPTGTNVNDLVLVLAYPPQGGNG